VFVTLVIGIVGTTWGLVRAEKARQAETERAQGEQLARQHEAEQRQLAEANARQAVAEKQIAEAVRQFLQRDLLRQADATAQANAVRQLGGDFETKKNPTIEELLDRAAAELTPAKIEAKFPGHGEVQASILRTVGETYQGIAEFGKAAEFLARAADGYRSALGPGHPETLAALNNLAGAYRDDGKYLQAIALYEQVRDGRIKQLGADHLDTLNTLSNLAGAYEWAGKLSEAIALYEQVRDVQVKRLGDEHPDTLTTLRSLAEAYGYAGKLSQAIALHEQVRDVQVKKWGFDHPETINNLMNLGAIYVHVGRLAEGIALLEQVHAAQVKQLGADHISTLDTLHFLASAHQSSGNLPRAIALLEQVRDAQVRKLGADHSQTLTSFCNLAVFYQSAGRREQALELLQQAAEGVERRQFQGTYAGRIIDRLSECHESLEQYAEAEAWRRKCLALLKHREGPTSPAYAAELGELGRNLLAQQRDQDAIEVLRPCLALRQKQEPDAWTPFDTQSMLGEALLLQRHYTEAEPLLLAGNEGLKQRETTITPRFRQPRLDEALQRLVRLYEATKQKDKAALWRKNRAALSAQSSTSP
jgi:tetratricopeptide (TPR) repeat protein